MSEVPLYTHRCVLVFYSPRRNRQTQFLSSTNNKPLSAVAFSRDGALVAAGYEPPHMFIYINIYKYLHMFSTIIYIYIYMCIHSLYI